MVCEPTFLTLREERPVNRCRPDIPCKDRVNCEWREGGVHEERVVKIGITLHACADLEE